jgi:hypothetical protein
MLERVREAPCQDLYSDEVLQADSGQYWGHIQEFHKLERLQYFDERGFPSWDAFAVGRWEDSLRELELDRPNVEAEFAEDRQSGLVSYRVRVVELPVTPYVQWEVHSLKIRAEYGENIRVLGPEAVARYEESGMLPELIFLGKQVMYETGYDRAGVQTRRRKRVDPELIDGCLADIQALYDQGEDLATFFEREVAQLPPPVVELIPRPGS